MKLGHEPFEKYPLLLLLGILFVVSIGGLVEISLCSTSKSTIEKVEGCVPTRRSNCGARHLRPRGLLSLP